MHHRPPQSLLRLTQTCALHLMMRIQHHDEAPSSAAFAGGCRLHHPSGDVQLAQVFSHSHPLWLLVSVWLYFQSLAAESNLMNGVGAAETSQRQRTNWSSTTRVEQYILLGCWGWGRRTCSDWILAAVTGCYWSLAQVSWHASYGNMPWHCCMHFFRLSHALQCEEGCQRQSIFGAMVSLIFSDVTRYDLAQCHPPASCEHTPKFPYYIDSARSRRHREADEW